MQWIFHMNVFNALIWTWEKFLKIGMQRIWTVLGLKKITWVRGDTLVLQGLINIICWKNCLRLPRNNYEWLSKSRTVTRTYYPTLLATLHENIIPKISGSVWQSSLFSFGKSLKGLPFSSIKKAIEAVEVWFVEQVKN